MSGIESHIEAKRSTDFLTGNAILICGFFGAAALVLVGNATRAISRFIYIHVDLPGFCVAAAIVGISAVFYCAGPISPVRPGTLRLLEIKPWHIASVALVVMIACVEPVYHGFAFSMDEYMTEFQAEIFAAGKLAGEVPVEWRDVGRALNHGFARYDVTSGQVYSTYRPGMAALTAAFDLAGMGAYTSAVLSAGSIILVASIARHLWPCSRSAPLVAALIVATSQQVLITGLTSYAMPAHLFFNLLWIRLFLLDRPWAHGLAALVGVATAALHQVHPHLFFAAPFLLTLFRPFRAGLLLFYGIIYALGHVLIIGWDQIALGAAATGAGQSGTVEVGIGFIGLVAKIFTLPGWFELSTIAALIVRLVAWQNLVLVPLLVIAARRAEWSMSMWLLAASIASSLLPYVFLMPDQGHGWGYRYLHGLIGNLALIATAGWLAVEKMIDSDRRRIAAPLLVAGVLSVTVMLPLRAVQVEQLVSSFANAYQYIRTTAADVVVVDTPSIYYGQDLVRNTPFLENRPVLLDIRHLDVSRIQRLCAAHPHSVDLVDADDLAGFGLPRTLLPARPPPDRDGMLRTLKDARCAPSR